MKITLAQIAPKLNRSNLENIIEIIKKNQDDSDLIVFPELALNGYLLQDKLYEDAFTIEELDKIKNASLHVDIVVGAAIRDKDKFRNTALYFSEGELLSKHYKVHLPNYGMFEEARYFEAGDIFESFTCRDKKISMVICEDLWHESVHIDLIKENPDYIIALVASPARGFCDDGLEIEDKWVKIIKNVAGECNSKLIFVNRIGFEDGLGFWGGSCIVDENADILYKLAHYEEKIKTFTV